MWFAIGIGTQRRSTSVKGPQKRSGRRLLVGMLAPAVAALAALLVGAVMLWALGASPFEAYRVLFREAFGSVDGLASTAVKAIPLVLVGVGITIAFRANGVWGAIPGALKAYFNVNEILSTIMLNIVAVQIMNLLLRGPLLDETQIGGLSRVPQTERLSPNADLPILIGGTRLHAGVLVALIAAAAAYVLLWRTTFGYRLRAVGLSREASRYAGMPVRRTITLALALSGALAGLAGAVLVFGSESHRMVTDGTTTGFTGAAGFNGIVVALFGGLHPLGTVVASFLFGGLLVGGNALQRAVQVPSALIVALNGLLVVFVVSTEFVRRRARLRPESPEGARDVGPGPEPAVEPEPLAAGPERGEP